VFSHTRTVQADHDFLFAVTPDGHFARHFLIHIEFVPGSLPRSSSQDIARPAGVTRLGAAKGFCDADAEESELAA
jgi:hypothetical protein